MAATISFPVPVALAKRFDGYDAAVVRGQREVVPRVAHPRPLGLDVRNPVLRLSIDSKHSEPGDLQRNLENQLTRIENSAGIEPSDSTGPLRFNNLIWNLYRKTGQQVVILADEYGKPVFDVLQNKAQAKANCDYLQGVFGIIKG